MTGGRAMYAFTHFGDPYTNGAGRIPCEASLPTVRSVGPQLTGLWVGCITLQLKSKRPVRTLAASIP